MADFRIRDLNKQIVTVKLCLKLRKSVRETFAMIKMVYGDIAKKHATCFHSHGRFKDGLQLIEVYERPGLPST